MSIAFADNTVIDTTLSWLKSNPSGKVTLITLLHVSGSGPRKEGALLAISDNGDICGSVSGGCIEEDLIRRFGSRAADKIEIVNYGINQAEAAKFQLPCGATVQLLIEPFNDVAQIREMSQKLNRRELFVRTLNLESGQSTLEIMDDSADWQFDVYHSGTEVKRHYGPVWQALIVGANDIASSLKPLLENLNFYVSICEPRPAYRQSWPGDSEQISSLEPEEWLQNIKIDKRTALMFISHDAKIEDLAILSSLDSPAFYIGALGSRQTTGKRHQRLIEHFDACPQKLKKLDAPIGFDLRSKTTPEIAVAIAAKLIAVRNGLSSEAIISEATIIEKILEPHAG